MAGFNFSEAVGGGLGFSWRSRAIIMPHAFWPLSLKISIFIILALTGYENDVLRKGLIEIPSYILEGLLVAYVVRFALLGEAQPLPLARRESDTAEMIAQKRAIFASMLVYVLVKLVVSFTAGLMLVAGSAQQGAGASSPPGGMLAAIGMAAMMIWGFRLVWLYIPVALDYPINTFLKRIEGFRISFNMLGLWILCTIPTLMLIVLSMQIVAAIFPGPAVGVLSIPAAIILAVLRAVAETAVAVVANVAMAMGLREALSTKK